jgi:hypothetical protein
MPDDTQNENNTQYGKTSIDSLVEETVEKAPRVREEIVEKLFAEEKNDQSDSNSDTPASTNTNPQSRYEQFNPAIHSVDETGNPRRTKSGAFAKKRGRKAGQTNSTTENTTNPPNGNPQSEFAQTVDYSGLSAMICTMLFGTLSMAMGPHWQPNPDEATQIQQQTAKVMEHYGVSDIPPVIGLCIVVGIYALPRAMHPDTKKRLQELGIIDTPPQPKTVPNERK